VAHGFLKRSKRQEEKQQQHRGKRELIYKGFLVHERVVQGKWRGDEV